MNLSAILKLVRGVHLSARYGVLSRREFGLRLRKLLVTLKATSRRAFTESRTVRDRFVLHQIESQRPKQALRVLTLG